MLLEEEENETKMIINIQKQQQKKLKRNYKKACEKKGKTKIKKKEWFQ